MNSIHILLVEDNAGDVRLTQEAFQEAKITNDISVVFDGEDAINFLNRRGGYASAPRPDTP
jgi:CheY-like chemotaxis protein